MDRRTPTELTDEVDRFHQESMRTIGSSRRRFLAGAAAGGAAITVGSMVLPIGQLVPSASAMTADLDLAQFTASIELALVELYRAAVDSGQLRVHVSDMAATFGNHHQDHANAVNTMIGEEETVTDANAALLDQYRPMIEGAADEAAVLEVLFSLEEATASTYLATIGELKDATEAGTFATILPVDSQHATVIATLLNKPAGDYLIEFVTTDAAFDVNDYPVATGDESE